MRMIARYLVLAFALGLAGCPPAAPPPAPLKCEYPASDLVPRLPLPSPASCEGGLEPGAIPNAYARYLSIGPVAPFRLCKRLGLYSPNQGCAGLATARGSFINSGVNSVPGGFSSEPWPDDAPDSLHDGDSGGDVCPAFMGVLDILKKNEVTPLEIRTDDFTGGQLHLEWQWCRHFTGAVALQEERDDAGVPVYGPVTYSFAPAQGDELAVFGDWVMDFATEASRLGPKDGGTWAGGGKAELHEVWMYATRSKDIAEGGADVGPALLAVNGGYGHAIDFRVSAQLPHADVGELWLQAVVPPRPASESNLTKFECRQVQRETIGCPVSDVAARVEGADCPGPRCTVTPDGGLVTFVIQIDPQVGAELATTFECENWTCGRTPESECRTRTCFHEKLAEFGTCNIPKAQGGKPVFAGVFRCNWKDPLDLWSCADCRGRNSAQVGATIREPIVGCAPLGLDPSLPEGRRQACNAVCGGMACGDAPSCRIGVSGPPTTTADVSARLLARDGCVPPAPFNRVAPMGDYRVELVAGSLLRFGTVDPTGSIESFSEIGRTGASGFLYINLGRPGEPEFPSLEVPYLELHGAPFSFITFPLTSHPVTDASAVTLTRSRAARRPGGVFEFPAGALLLAARATIDAQPGGAEVVSQGTVTGNFDPAAGTFTLDAVGRDEQNLATVLHLVGTVTNRPPIADTGPSRDVECGSATTTAVVLDGTGSRDPDVGDSITEYQWFKEELRREPGSDDEFVPISSGAGIGPTIAVQVALGEHLFRLHVYDRHVGSGSTEAILRVVDTTPPVLTLPDPVCLWPPNHEFARFKLGVEIPFGVEDTCDAQPSVRIISVTSNEAVNATGSGNTSPDVVFGPTTACVRSERSGSGTGRSYAVVVEARDATGNQATRTITVTVPHDMSGNPNCVRATGLSSPDSSCSL